MVKTLKNIGEVLREARQSRGFTQADIGPELNVSRATVAQMETGRRAVKAEDLSRLAAFYRCSPSELMPTTSGEQGMGGAAELFQAYPDLSTDEGERSFSRVYELARSLTEVESMLGIDAITHMLPSYQMEPAGSSWQAARQGYRAAEDERRRLALGEGPIRFLDELLTTLRVRAAKASLPGDITSIWMCQPDCGFLIVVDEDLSLGHRRFGYAHGLAHSLFDSEGLWRVCGSDAAPGFAEVRADAFASGLLLPEHGVRRYLETLGKETLGRAGPTVLSVFPDGAGKKKAGENRRVDGRQRTGRQAITLSDVMRVAHYYGTSPSLTVHRLRDLRLLTDAHLEKLENMMRGERHPRSDRALGLPEALYEMDPLCSRLAAMAASAYGRGFIDEQKFETLVALAGVREAHRERLLAMTAAPG